MPTATTDIAPAVAADVPVLGEVLARAFQDDPVFAWIMPEATRRRACLPPMFAAFAEAYLPHGETYLAGDGAAAMWAPAGSEPIGEEQLEAFGERMAAALGADAGRAWELNALLEQHHPAQPCFYLQFLGVVPDQQGRGIGSRLLRAVLRRCDATGTPAYLEATSVANRRLYRRHGFDTVGELTVAHGPPLWPMWRRPVTASAEANDRPR